MGLKSFKKKAKKGIKSATKDLGVRKVRDMIVGPNLEKAARDAKRAEHRKLTALEKKEREEARFATSEGEGIAELANINLFLDEDEDDEEFLGTGEVGDLGLFI